MTNIHVDNFQWHGDWKGEMFLTVSREELEDEKKDEKRGRRRSSRPRERRWFSEGDEDRFPARSRSHDSRRSSRNRQERHDGSLYNGLQKATSNHNDIGTGFSDGEGNKLLPLSATSPLKEHQTTPKPFAIQSIPQPEGSTSSKAGQSAQDEGSEIERPPKRKRTDAPEVLPEESENIFRQNETAKKIPATPPPDQGEKELGYEDGEDSQLEEEGDAMEESSPVKKPGKKGARKAPASKAKPVKGTPAENSTKTKGSAAGK